MKIYRSLLGCDTPVSVHLNDREVIDKLQVYSPLTMLVLMRLKLLERVIRKASIPLLCLICSLAKYEHANTWVNTVYSHLKVLAVHEPKLEELKEATFVKWIEFIKLNSRAFLKLIVQATSSETVNAPKFWWPASGSSSQGLPNDPTTYACDFGECTFSCGSIQGLSWHLFNEHGVRHELRHCVRTTHCLCCLQEFFTRERIVRHITRSSPRCKMWYYQEAEPIDPALLKSMDDEAYKLTCSLAKKGKRREYAASPADRLSGPLTVEAMDLGVSFTHLLKCPPR
jgi:hypothetical protein